MGEMVERGASQQQAQMGFILVAEAVDNQVLVAGHGSLSLGVRQSIAVSA
jgi:hypothetical protein